MKYLSICALVKDEALYIREWIEFHLKQGVEHFFLYDNGSTDQTKQEVAEYCDKVTWHDLPGRMQQRVAYNHMLRHHRSESEWVSFTDVDEFLFANSPTKRLSAMLEKFEECAGVAVHWLIYGSSGHLEYSPEPVTQRFTRRADCVNPHVKSIMKLKDTYSTGNNVHTFRAHGLIVDENFAVQPEEYAYVTPATANILRINHYVTKSKTECEVKRLRGRADTGGINTENFFEQHDRNDMVDETILDFV